MNLTQQVSQIFSDKETQVITLTPGESAIFHISASGICGTWTPSRRRDRKVKAEWDMPESSTLARSAPVVSVFNIESRNILTFALSDTVHPYEILSGVREEDGTLRVKIMPGDLKHLPLKLLIYITCRDARYEDVLCDVNKWWETNAGYSPLPIPDSACQPLYSTWYSFHQNFNDQSLEKEYVLAKNAGFETIILDDGWQTKNTERGYAFCGDWEIEKTKIRNIYEHIAKVHALGMKYLFWFSVPFVGIHSKAYHRFRKMLLHYDADSQAGILDLRYPEVREYLTGIYRRAVAEWGLDGLKLDFIDRFVLYQDTPAENNRMDISSIEESLQVFLFEVRDVLTKIKQDILIEFRQDYVGPAIRIAGNILRVSDCPLDAVSNRVGSIDLRLISGKCAIHSDMIMWNPDGSVPDAVRFIFANIFSTVQLSIRFEDQKDEMLNAITFWIRFMKEYAPILQKGILRADHPENLYPHISSEKDHIKIHAVYEGNTFIRLNEAADKEIILNASESDEICFCAGKTDAEYSLLVSDACGRMVRKGKQHLTADGFFAVNTGSAGMVTLNRINR